MSYRSLFISIVAGATLGLAPAHAHQHHHGGEHAHHHEPMHHGHHHVHSHHGHAAGHHDGDHHSRFSYWLPNISLTLAGTYKTAPMALNQRPEGFALGHTELSVYDTIGGLFFGKATIVAHSHAGSVEFELEEAFIETRSLPYGLQIRAGRFLSQIGRLNGQHPHEDSFVERPLLYRAFLGGHYFDDGARLNWQVPVSGVEWKLGIEALNGEQLLGGDIAYDGVGVITYSTALAGEIGSNQRWAFGLSYVDNRIVGETHGHEHAEHEHGHEHDHGHEHGHGHHHGARYTGEDLYIAYASWAWAPTGQPHEQQLRLSAEYARAADLNEHATSDDIHQAWYAQAVYRFHPQWSVGIRHGALKLSIPHEDHFHDGQLSETAVMVAWKPSHRSTLRFQYSHQYSDSHFKDESEDAFMLQYVLILGVHHHDHGF